MEFIRFQGTNGKNPLFDAALIRKIIKNPVYCGKIAYGRRKTEKVHGTRNEYKLVEQDDFIVVDGIHEGIISEELWQKAQIKSVAQAKKYEHVNKAKGYQDAFAVRLSEMSSLWSRYVW